MADSAKQLKVGQVEVTTREVKPKKEADVPRIGLIPEANLDPGHEDDIAKVILFSGINSEGPQLMEIVGNDIHKLSLEDIRSYFGPGLFFVQALDGKGRERFSKKISIAKRKGDPEPLIPVEKQVEERNGHPDWHPVLDLLKGQRDSSDKMTSSVITALTSMASKKDDSGDAFKAISTMMVEVSKQMNETNRLMLSMQQRADDRAQESQRRSDDRFSSLLEKMSEQNAKMAEQKKERDPVMDSILKTLVERGINPPSGGGGLQEAMTVLRDVKETLMDEGGEIPMWLRVAERITKNLEVGKVTESIVGGITRSRGSAPERRVVPPSSPPPSPRPLPPSETHAPETSSNPPASSGDNQGEPERGEEPVNTQEEKQGLDDPLFSTVDRVLVSPDSTPAVVCRSFIDTAEACGEGWVLGPIVALEPERDRERIGAYLRKNGVPHWMEEPYWTKLSQALLLMKEEIKAR